METDSWPELRCLITPFNLFASTACGVGEAVYDEDACLQFFINKLQLPSVNRHL